MAIANGAATSATTSPTTGVSTDRDGPSGRRRVLGAAAELFVAQGYHGTTLRQIGAAAGIKAGSVYHHVDSKEAMFVAILDDGITAMLDAFDRAEAELPADAGTEARIAAHIRAHLSAVFEHGPYTTAHVTAFFSAPAEVRAQAVPARDRYEQRWTTLLAELFPAAGARRLRLNRLFLFGAMNATPEWFDPAGNLSLDELASSIAGQFLNGVGA